MNSVIRSALIAFMAFWMTLLTAFSTVGMAGPYPGWLNALLGAELSAAVVNGWVAFGWKASKLVREQHERREDERELREFRRGLDAAVRPPGGTHMAVGSRLAYVPRYFDDIAFVPRYRVVQRRRIRFEELEPGILVDGVRVSSGHLEATVESVQVVVCAAHGNEVPCPLCTPMDYYWRRP